VHRAVPPHPVPGVPESADGPTDLSGRGRRLLRELRSGHPDGSSLGQRAGHRLAPSPPRSVCVPCRGQAGALPCLDRLPLGPAAGSNRHGHGVLTCGGADGRGCDERPWTLVNETETETTARVLSAWSSRRQERYQFVASTCCCRASAISSVWPVRIRLLRRGAVHAAHGPHALPEGGRAAGRWYAPSTLASTGTARDRPRPCSPKVISSERPVSSNSTVQPGG
jgi:hypothetical protein